MSVTTSRGMTIFKNCGISYTPDQSLSIFVLTSNLDIAIIPINENYKSVTINNYDGIYIRSFLISKYYENDIPEFGTNINDDVLIVHPKFDGLSFDILDGTKLLICQFWANQDVRVGSDFEVTFTLKSDERIDEIEDNLNNYQLKKQYELFANKKITSNNLIDLNNLSDYTNVGGVWGKHGGFSSNLIDVRNNKIITVSNLRGYNPTSSSLYKRIYYGTYDLNGDFKGYAYTTASDDYIIDTNLITQHTFTVTSDFKNISFIRIVLKSKVDSGSPIPNNAFACHGASLLEYDVYSEEENEFAKIPTTEQFLYTYKGFNLFPNTLIGTSPTYGNYKYKYQYDTRFTTAHLTVNPNTKLSVKNATPIRFLFFTEEQISSIILGDNVIHDYLTSNTTGIVPDSAVYCVINFRNSDNPNGYNEICIQQEILEKEKVWENELSKVTIKDSSIYVRSHLNETNDIVICLHETKGNISLYAVYVGPKTLNDSSILTSDYFVHSVADSIGAIGVQTFWFLYAQHGWTIPRASTSGTSIDTSDIGSEWKDQNDRHFTIGNVSGGYIYLLPILTKDDETNVYSASWDGEKAYPTTLTHVSGATHTTQISKTFSRYDLIIQNCIERKFIADGVEITGNATVYCDKFEIKDRLQGFNIGETTTWFPTPVYNTSLIDWDKSFTFIGHTLEFNSVMNVKYPFKLQDYRGCIPQMPLQRGDYHSYSFIPKVKKYKNNYGWKQIIRDNTLDLYSDSYTYQKGDKCNINEDSNYSYESTLEQGQIGNFPAQRIDLPFNSDDGTIDTVSVTRNSVQLYNVNDQPDRVITYLKDDKDNYLVGFAGGGNITVGMFKPENRNIYCPINSNTCTYGGSSTPNKFYPKPLQGAAFTDNIVNDDFIGTMSCYYSWFDPNINTAQVYYHIDGTSYIVYVHCQTDIPKCEIKLPSFMEDLVVDEIIEKTEGSSMLTNKVVTSCIYCKFDTTNDIANYIVFRLK